jgi:hypothetical protein
MLVQAVIRSRARSLVNELIEGYFLEEEFDNWISDAALDISSKTFCYVVNEPITLIQLTELYTLPLDTLKVMSVTFRGVGLDRITTSMKGKQTAVPTGVPKYFYEMIDKIGLNPVPTPSEADENLDLYISITTELIINIPSKFQVPATLFVASMALIKQKQYDKATQLYNLYLSSLGLDRQDIAIPQLETPPPQNQYVLKIAMQPQTQQG